MTKHSRDTGRRDVYFGVQMKFRRLNIKPGNEPAHETWMGNFRFATYTPSNIKNEKISISAEMA